MSSVKNTDDYSIIQDLRENICENDFILIESESLGLEIVDND